jgi:outer membrane PBP1 activator LpoA protein
MTKNIRILVLTLICTLFLLNGCSQSMSQFLPQTAGNDEPSTAIRANISDDAFWQGNPTSIWDRLQHTSLQKLDAAANNPDATKAAWIKLAIISKRYNKDTKQLTQQLLEWQKANPSHPGNQLISSNSTLTTVANTNPPKHIALLLPLQGPMGSSGQSVRDGFLSAYYQSLATTHYQQTISFYDTSSNPNVVALYQQAISAGADIVVGPLLKEDVQTLLSNGSFQVPTLALNYTDSWGSLPNNVYEFGLSSADETQQLADKAWRERRNRAIVIAPDNAWGQHIAKTTIARWQSAGGSVTETFYFSPQTDLNSSIANLLHANPVNDRTKTNVAASQQRRQDFDVIFLLTQPQDARAIVPLLKYYYANNVPIYATSSIYAGTPNPQKDSDLNGVIFSDIPWTLKGSPANSNRLFAVGRDAYLISSELPRLTMMPNFSLYAATGALTLTSKHQIYRRLPWATMHAGHP